jgi:hypothetical protein
MSKKKVSAKGQSSISKYFTEKPTIKAPKVTKDEEKTEKELESTKKIQDQLDKVQNILIRTTNQIYQRKLIQKIAAKI